MARNAVKAIPPSKRQLKAEIIPPRPHALTRMQQRHYPVSTTVQSCGHGPARRTVEDYEEIVETRTVKRRRVETEAQPVAASTEPAASVGARVASVIFMWGLAGFLAVFGSVSVIIDQPVAGVLLVAGALFPLGAGVSINNYSHD